jgi:hypothetical protein
MRIFDFYPAYELSVWLINKLNDLVILIIMH